MIKNQNQSNLKKNKQPTKTKTAPLIRRPKPKLSFTFEIKKKTETKLDLSLQNVKNKNPRGPRRTKELANIGLDSKHHQTTSVHVTVRALWWQSDLGDLNMTNKQSI